MGGLLHVYLKTQTLFFRCLLIFINKTLSWYFKWTHQNTIILFTQVHCILTFVSIENCCLGQIYDIGIFILFSYSILTVYFRDVFFLCQSLPWLHVYPSKVNSGP